MSASTTAPRPPSAQQTQHPPPPCRLLSLPPELRKRIYDQTLINPTSEELILTPHATTPPLLRTCRQIRAEGTSIYFSKNLFLVANGESVVIPWLKVLSYDMRKHLTTVRLYTKVTEEEGMRERQGKWRVLLKLNSEIRRARLGRQLRLEVFVMEAGKVRWTGTPLSLNGRRASRRASRKVAGG